MMRSRTSRLIHRLAKQAKDYVSFICPWSQNGSFPTPKNSCKLEISAALVRPCVQNVSRKVARQLVLLATLTEKRREVVQGTGSVIKSPTLLGLLWMWR